MVRKFKPDDQGKTVRTESGEEVGTIETISGDMAHVKPPDSLSKSIRRRLGWTGADEMIYELRHDSVIDIQGDAVVIRD